MSLPRYPTYKDSGVEWLGAVPGHWEVRPLKRISREPIQNGVGAAADCDIAQLPRYVRITDIKSSRELHSDTFRSLPPAVADTATFHVGDILFACVGATFGKSYLHTADIGPVCYAGYLAKFSPDRFTDSRFVAYWSESVAYWAQLNANAIGSTIQNFSASKYGELDIAVPPRAEQAQIATFLDRETAKVDSLVAEQQRLIELLKEKRQAVINHAVTNGLNPKAAARDSGIAWLGEVPEHWTVARLGYYSTVENGTTPSREDRAFWDDGNVPWLASGEVNQGRVTGASEFITEKALRECSLRLIPAGAVVIGMIGQGKTRGLSALLEIDATINQNLAAIVTDRRLSSAFLQLALTTAYDYLREFGRGGQQAALNCEILKSLRVPVPPAVEQEAICGHLRRALPEFDTLIAEAQRAIDLLQERRTAVISAAVTGQIDVRPAAERASA
jgi:type I restriction enzyme S subunit